MLDRTIMSIIQCDRVQPKRYYLPDSSDLRAQRQKTLSTGIVNRKAPLWPYRGVDGQACGDEQHVHTSAYDAVPFAHEACHPSPVQSAVLHLQSESVTLSVTRCSGAEMKGSNAAPTRS